MNSIQNYGVANYQIGFRARGANKAVKTLADLKSMNHLERKNYETNKVFDKLFKLVEKLDCKCDSNNSMNEGILDGINCTFKNYV